MSKVLFLNLWLVFALTALCAAEESYGYMNGNRLLEKCDAGTSQDKVFCSGYVAGVMDGHVTLLNSLTAATETKSASRMYCLPKGGIEVGQAVRVTVKWLRDHPEKLHLAGDVLVGMALQDAFPCK